MAVMITVLLGLTLMLDGALSQTRPVIPNSFMMSVSGQYTHFKIITDDMIGSCGILWRNWTK